MVRILNPASFFFYQQMGMAWIKHTEIVEYCKLFVQIFREEEQGRGKKDREEKKTEGERKRE